MTTQRTSSTRLGWWSLIAGLIAYAIGIMHRTSFGVATPQAAEHFNTSATTLSIFVVVQLLVYTACQIPIGIALDRFGARALIGVGSFIMAGGQLALAFTDTVVMAIAARGFIGAGDACIFISLVRLLPAWFAPKQVPLLTQVVSMVGQSGQFLSAVPFLATLHAYGWQVSFLSAAVVGFAAATLASVVIRNGPGATVTTKTAPTEKLIVRSDSGATLASVLREPGSWLAFWSHWITAFSSMVALFMWGVPFFTTHQLTTAETSLALLGSPIIAILGGPLIGRLSSRYPLRRSWLVLGFAALSLVAWVGVLAPAKPLPAWALLGWMMAISLGGPISLVAFDFTRTFNTPRRLGKATGFTNTGGFTAAIISTFMVGVILDVVAPGGMSTYTLADFRLAFSFLLLPWIVGVVGVIWSRRSVRTLMAEYGVLVAPARERLRALARIRKITQADT